MKRRSEFQNKTTVQVGQPTTQDSLTTNARKVDLEAGVSDVEKRPPANLARDDTDDLPPWDDRLPNNSQTLAVSEKTAEAAAGHPVRGYTGSTCPACGLAQMWCLSGVTCPNGHGFGHDDVSLQTAPTKLPADSSGLAPQSGVTGPTQAETIPRPDPDPEAVLAPVLPDHGQNQEPAPEAPIPEPVQQAPIRPKGGSRKPKQKPKPKSEEPTGDRSPVEAAPADGSYRREQREAVARRLDELVLGDGYERIIEHVFTIDPWSAYEALQKRLTLPVPAHAQTKALLFDELDAAELRAKEAHQLFISAKETVRRFEHDVVVMTVDMRAQATASLQAEKDSGQRSKQITDADVESRMASMFPDEWRQTEMRKSRAKLMVDHMQRLSDAWKERARDLRSMFDGK